MFSEKTADILRLANMSCRASFYSGRGVTSSDLNDKHLFKIHESVQKEYGDKAAKAFVVMVRDLPVLSASEFLDAFEILERGLWKWRKENVAYVSGVSAEKDDPGGTMMGVMLAMNDTTPKERKIQQSNVIKAPFLVKVLSKAKFKAWEMEHGGLRNSYGS